MSLRQTALETSKAHIGTNGMVRKALKSPVVRLVGQLAFVERSMPFARLDRRLIGFDLGRRCQR
jgi:hypothetical protein